MRQIRLATEAGYEVGVAGYGTPADAVPADFTAFPAPRPGLTHKAGVALRQGPSLLAGMLASPLYWTSAEARQVLAAARHFRPDLVHANDWPALPVAARLGLPYVYDSHEFASGEHDEWLLWRLFYKPYVTALERAYGPDAACVTTVSDGIAERLQTLYGLAVRPTTIRNMPRYRALPFRPTGAEVEILYHGAYNPERGLEELIDSVALWPERFRLKLRGIGAPAYIEALRTRASGSAASARIAFADPVGADDLVEAAATSDIGIFTIPPKTIQSDYALPNKFFEYAMAGLCLVVSPAKEMAGLVRDRRLGMVTAGSTPQDIAATLTGLSREQIDAAKRASLEAAKELNWDHEKQRLLDIWRSLA